MSEGIKSRKCEDCGHIFEYALWASSCPNCTSTHLQVVDGPPPKPKKKAVQLISDAPIADPNRHVPEAKLIHHDGVRESHLEIPDGGIPLIIDEESRTRPSTLLLHEVKLILDESSEPYMSKLDMEEIELLIMDIEDQYRPDPDAPPVKPMTPEEIAKAAVKKRLERLKAQNADMDLPPVSANGAALPPIQHSGEGTNLSFSRRAQRPERLESATPPPQTSVATSEKKGFLSRRKAKVEEQPTPAPRKTMFQNNNQSEPVDFTKELGPNRSLALPEVEEMVPPRSRFRNPDSELNQSVVGKRELPLETEKGKREIVEGVEEIHQQPIGQVAQAPQQPIGQVAQAPQQPIGQVAQAPQQPIGQVVQAPQQPIGQVAQAPQQPIGQVAQVSQQPIGQVVQDPQQPIGQVAQAPQPPIGQVAQVPQQPIGQVAQAPQQPIGQVAQVSQQPIGQVAQVPQQPVPAVEQQIPQTGEPMENTARRRFNLPPLEAVEDDILPPITADGKIIPPLHQAPDPSNVGIGKKPRLQPPPQAPVKKGFFKKKK